MLFARLMLYASRRSLEGWLASPICSLQSRLAIHTSRDGKVSKVILVTACESCGCKACPALFSIYHTKMKMKMKKKKKRKKKAQINDFIIYPGPIGLHFLGIAGNS
ncbi:hypothetical protein V8C37DRAFT_380486 [Trichoderma ceciliae]